VDHTDRLSKAGWVAEVSSTVVPKCSVSSLSASRIGTSKAIGSACTSSSTSTALASRCSLRDRAGLRPNKESNSWTVVVTTNGASQFSAASRNRSPRSASSNSACEWCSSTVCSPSNRRYTPAFCSVIVRNGTATITRALW
jgi:hypothetical protein